MINLGELIDKLDDYCSKTDGMYRILFNGKWISGAKNNVFETEKSAKLYIHYLLSWQISNFLCEKEYGFGLYALSSSKVVNGFDEKYFKKEAKNIIDQLIKKGTIVIEEIK
jgi:hypothetical protein